MAAQITVESITVEFIAFQVDRLGYVLCGACACEDRGTCRKTGPRGRRTEAVPAIEEREAADVLRSFEGASSQPCSCCGKLPPEWPRVMRTVRCTVEHTTCRIF